MSAPYDGVSAFLGQAWDAKLEGQWGSRVSNSSATGLQRAMHDVEAAHMMAVPGQLIIENQDPALVQDGANLAYLAYGMGVTLWEASWSTSQKREWLANQWTFKANVGLLPAIEMALAINGFDIIDVVTPPGGFYVSPDLSVEEENHWISLMPEIRIALADKVGLATADEAFFDDDGDGSFLDDFAFPSIDEGPGLYGRKAYLREADGTETELQTYDIITTVGIETGPSIQQIVLPEFDATGLYCDDSFLDDDVYMTDDDASSRTYTVQIEHSMDVTNQEISITPLYIGLDPLTPRFTRESDTVIDTLGIYLDDWPIEDDAYLMPEDAGDMLADVLHLFDPKVATPQNEGSSYLDEDRIGVPNKYAEIMIDTHTLLELDAATLEDVFLDDDVSSYMVPEDLSDVDRACRAVVAGKALRDTVLLSFEPTRPIEFEDQIDETTVATDYVPNRL